MRDGGRQAGLIRYAVVSPHFGQLAVLADGHDPLSRYFPALGAPRRRLAVLARRWRWWSGVSSRRIRPQSAALLWDKAEHFIAYFGLTLLASLAWGLRRSLVWVFAAMMALGGALEIIQSFVGRDAEWGDFFANDLGAAGRAGVAVVYLLIPRRRLVARAPSH